MADINLDIALDDEQLFRALNATEKQLKEIDKEADKTGKSMSDAFRKADKSVEQLNKELKKTDAELKRASTQAGNVSKSFSSSIRSFRRDTSAVFAGIAGGAVAAVAGVQKLAENFVPLVAINKRIAEASQEAINGFVEERTKLEQLTAAAQDEKSTQDQRNAAKQALINQYKEYLPNIDEEIDKTNGLINVNKLLREEIIKRTAEQAKEQIKTQLIAELGTKILEAEQQKFIASVSRGTVVGAFTDAQSIYTDLQAGAIKSQLTLLDNVEQQLAAALRELDKNVDFTTAPKLTAKEITNLGKTSEKTAEQNKILAGSIADLEKQLAAVNTQIKEQTSAQDEEALQPLVDKAVFLEQQIKNAQDALDKLRAAPQAPPAPIIPEEEVEDIIDNFEKIQAAFDENAEARRTALEATQSAELLRLKQTGTTEEEITKLQKAQEKERQLLALQTEQKRLELILQYGSQRTEAEAQILDNQLAKIKDEIAGFSIEVTDSVAKATGGKKSIFSILGLDPNTEEGAAAISAIEQGIGMAVDSIQNLVAAQLAAANEQISIRDKNISNLSQQLEQELALNEAGFASNVEITRRELEEQRKARAEALEDARKAQVAQLVIDTALQTSSLITSAAEIFQSFAALPFGIGIPIAAGVIAAMFGSFIAAKAQAFKAVAPRRFSEGGQLPSIAEGGRTDKNGGRGHRIEGTNILVGGGEYVVNDQATAEHNALLERINAGDFKNVDLLGIIENRRRMVRGMQKNGDMLVLNQASNSDAAIERQTDVIVKYLNKILTKPEISAIDNEHTLEVYRDLRGNISTRIIKI